MPFGDNIEVAPKKVALYDMDIKDVQERALKRVVFPSLTRAGNFLGFPVAALTDRIHKKYYVYHRETGKQYAIRYEKNKE